MTYYKITNKKKRLVTTIADFFGYLFWSPVTLFKKKYPITNVREILVIRTAYIGDVVMTLPILKPLKKLYPDARITFLACTAACDIFKNNPYVDMVLPYDAFWFYPKGLKQGFINHWRFLKILRSKSYDLVIEARGDIRDILLLAYMSRSKFRVSYRVGGGEYLLTHVVPFEKIKHKVEYHIDIIRFLNGRCDQVEWGTYLTPQEKKSVQSLLSNERVENSDFVVAIHPGGRKRLKCWHVSRYAELADRIISRYTAKIIFTGSQEEQELISDIIKKMNHSATNYAGKIDLRLFFGLMKKIDLFVCNDSAPLHLSAAAGTPTVAIFGPSKSNETGPYGNTHRVVEKKCSCRATCDEDVCLHTSFHACMNMIAVDDVLEAVEKIITIGGNKNNEKSYFNLSTPIDYTARKR